MKKLILISGFVALMALSGFSQLKKATVKDLSFMSGLWHQKSDWGDLEEYWSDANGESMVSSFRCIKDGKALFYEFVVIEQEGDIPVMKMRHFNRGSIGWEDKKTPLLFPLTKLKEKLAVFTSADQSVRLSYQRDSDQLLTVILEEKDKAGKPKKEVFHFTKK